MNAEAVLRSKGGKVFTAAPDDGIADAVRKMQAEKIGALVVTGDGIEVAGIVTERDVLHGLAEHGVALLDMAVGDLMTCEVLTAKPDDEVGSLLALMTVRRCRHIPVMEKGRLRGVISIGDLVKSRLEETEHEANQLRDYIIRG